MIILPTLPKFAELIEIIQSTGDSEGGTLSDTDLSSTFQIHFTS